MAGPIVQIDGNTIRTIICSGADCPCVCGPGDPPDPPDPPNCCPDTLEDCYGYAIAAGGDGWWHSDDGAFTVEKGEDGVWRGSSPFIAIDRPPPWGPINYMNCTGATVADLQVDIAFWFEDSEVEGNYCVFVLYGRYRTSNEVLREDTFRWELETEADCPTGPPGYSWECGGDDGCPDQTNCAEWKIETGHHEFYDPLCPAVCDMDCVTSAFGGTTSQLHSIGDPVIGTVQLDRSLSPTGQICDQDTITGELVLNPGAFTSMSWEIIDSMDASNAIWTLVSSTHSNGDTGGPSTATLTVTFTWRYNADGVTDADIDENCCLVTLPEIGVEYDVGGTGPYTYYLTSGRNGAGTMSICGTLQ